MGSLFLIMASALATLRDDEAGAASIEYGLLASLIAIASLQALDSVSVALTGKLDTAREGMADNPVPNASSPPPQPQKQAPAAADEPSAPQPVRSR